MPSRKREKGKLRKAKSRASLCNLTLHDSSICAHGCVDIPTNDLCFRFVSQFEIDLDFILSNDAAAADWSAFEAFDNTMERIMKNHQEFRTMLQDQDIESRNRVYFLFLCLGSNMLLKKDKNTKPWQRFHLGFMATAVAIACLVVQNNALDDTNKLLATTDRDLARDLDQGGVHYDTIRFFKKRVPCQCLKDMYCRAKVEPKLIVCVGCRETYDRKLLLLCGNCKVSVAYSFGLRRRGQLTNV